MDTLAIIAVPFPDDDERIKLFIKNSIKEKPLALNKVRGGGGYLIKADLSSIRPERQTALKRTATSIRNQCYHISFYNLDKLNQNFNGSAKAENWKRNLPRKNGRYNFHWNHDEVRFPEAIKKVDANRAPLRLSDGFAQTGIKVMQFDTGFSDHPALSQSPGYKPNGVAHSVLDGQEAKDELRAYNLASKGFQKPSHGTATAGTFMAVGGWDESSWPLEPGAISGVKNMFLPPLAKGLFPFVKFIPVKISETVTLGGSFAQKFLPNVGASTNLPKGLQLAIDEEADVVTMSMGGSFGNKAVKGWYEKAYNAGIIMTCAAGNSKKADAMFDVIKPAEYPETIAVAAVEPFYSRKENNWLMKPWKQSCDGLQVDISAPGRYIYAPIALDPKRVNDASLKQELGDGFVYKFGGATSQATVHVAAAAAIWKYHFKNDLNNSFFNQKRSRIVEAFRFALYCAKQDPNWRRRDKRDYNGVLNVERMLDVRSSPNDPDCLKFIFEVEDHPKRNRRGIFNRLIKLKRFDNRNLVAN